MILANDDGCCLLTCRLKHVGRVRKRELWSDLWGIVQEDLSCKATMECARRSVGGECNLQLTRQVGIQQLGLLYLLSRRLRSAPRGW